DSRRLRRPLSARRCGHGRGTARGSFRPLPAQSWARAEKQPHFGDLLRLAAGARGVVAASGALEPAAFGGGDPARGDDRSGCLLPRFPRSATVLRAGFSWIADLDGGGASG